MKCATIALMISAIMRCSDCTHYDQSQSGDFNVQVGLKDLQIIALLSGGKEEYVDYDYAYDYNEMTIKPQNRTTPRPLNASTGTDTSVVSDKTTSAPPGQTDAPTKAPTESSETPTDVTVIDYNTTIKNSIDSSTEALPNNRNSTVNSNSTANVTRCKKGFVLNYKGECELKLHGTGNALLKLVKLSQKLKLKRENKDD
ncbi:unnamed protein product [Leptosia nina]|uniref:Uncharacterized protein n=1 Tax=Leptosia nina TaxID=320188 RepID=A0AAV1JBI4_9NEOP